MLVWARLAFLLANYGQFKAAPSVELLEAFVIGFRFDIATALITITPPFLPLWTPLPSKMRARLAVASGWLAGALLVAAGTLLWGDLLFYSENSRHITLEPVDALADFSPLIQTVIHQYLAAFVGLILTMAGMIFLLVRLFGRARSAEIAHKGWDWKRLGLFFPVAVVTFIGVRGGLQREPLKSADALFGGTTFVSNLVTNGWYSFLTEAIKPQRPYDLMPDSVAVAELRGMTQPDGGEFISDKYPLLRRTVPTAPIAAPGEKLNLVLIIVESLSAEFLQSFGGEVSIMPFLDSLAGKSLLYTNLQSVGVRSFRGVSAILTSFPNLAPDPYRITFLLPEMRGLGRILTEDGYAVRFMHGASVNSMGITAISQMAGYPEFVSRDDFPSSADNGSWGVWDHLALERMANDLDEMGEPSHYGVFTLGTHAPWTLPAGFIPRFAKDHPRAYLLNTFAYLDWALSQFFAREAVRDRFGRTLYVITGDHTTHSTEVDRFHIGCIFYAPGRITARADDRLASQLDIMPTILDLLGLEAVHSAFGSSLVSPHPRLEWSVHYQSNLLYYREGRRMLVSSIYRDIGLFDPADAQMSGGGFLAAEPGVADSLGFRLKVIYQMSEKLMRHNRIAPTTVPTPAEFAGLPYNGVN